MSYLELNILTFSNMFWYCWLDDRKFHSSP